VKETSRSAAHQQSFHPPLALDLFHFCLFSYAIMGLDLI
jgi:hypothetical protein